MMNKFGEEMNLTAADEWFAESGNAWFTHPHEYEREEELDGDRLGNCAVFVKNGREAKVLTVQPNLLYPGLMICMMNSGLTCLVTGESREEEESCTAKGLFCNETISVFRDGKWVIEDVPAAVENRRIITGRKTEPVTLQLNLKTKEIAPRDLLLFDSAWYRIVELRKEQTHGDECGILQIECEFMAVHR